MATLEYYDVITGPLINIENPTNEQIIDCRKSRHHNTHSALALYSDRKLTDYPNHTTDELAITACTRGRFFIQHNAFEPKFRFRRLIDKNVDPKARPVRYTSSNGEVFSWKFKETVDM